MEYHILYKWVPVKAAGSKRCFLFIFFYFVVLSSLAAIILGFSESIKPLFINCKSKAFHKLRLRLVGEEFQSYCAVELSHL